MGKQLLRVAAFVALGGIPSAWAQPSDLLTLDELVGDWKISRQFTLEVAGKMPAEFYDFRPNAEQLSFGGQMVHIAFAQAYRFHQLTGIAPPFPLDVDPSRADKDTVLKLLGPSFDYVIGVLPKITAEQMAKTFKVDWRGRSEVNGRQMMMNMFVHTAHHRAQCEVYLRVKNITPPTYTF